MALEQLSKSFGNNWQLIFVFRVAIACDGDWKSNAQAHQWDNEPIQWAGRTAKERR